MNKKDKMKILRDPKFVKSRIFVGNLPPCKAEELEGLCNPFGKILATNITKKFAFIQYETEEAATNAVSSLNKSQFKGTALSVSMAKNKVETNPSESSTIEHNINSNNSVNAKNMPIVNNANHLPTNEAPSGEVINDCEIIVIDRKNTQYAEYIEQRLTALYLRVDVLFPNADVPLGKVLSSIFNRGVLYAVLVTDKHEQHQSITVNILYGNPAEHRNMALEDAIALIADDFNKKMLAEGRPILPPSVQSTANISSYMNKLNLPEKVGLLQTPGLVPSLSLNDRHPESIQVLLNLLANNMPITALQYDKLIKYLTERRELQIKAELGDYNPTMGTSLDMQKDPEIELQRRIKDIMNKPLAINDNSHRLVYPNLNAVKDDPILMNLLNDFKVQNALEMLMNSNLVATIESAMKI